MNILTHTINDINGAPILFDPTNDNWVIDSFRMDQVFAPSDNENIDVEANNYVSKVEVDPFGDQSGPAV